MSSALQNSEKIHINTVLKMPPEIQPTFLIFLTWCNTSVAYPPQRDAGESKQGAAWYQGHRKHSDKLFMVHLILNCTNTTSAARVLV
jgi:hypothetical protein